MQTRYLLETLALQYCILNDGKHVVRQTYIHLEVGKFSSTEFSTDMSPASTSKFLPKEVNCFLLPT
ncbi:unnamed protein product [Schistosoma mattheei]|uniref:Uncharacterized protein n=1 Tax=Schistosoma mattheei TaxID=31246 RepID=A0A3P8AVP1_9TREM|nr:unnamed protein product [Schistosoma mattheei]